MFARYLKLLAFLLVIPFVFLGCSKDEDEGICSRVDVTIVIRPPEAGTVEEEYYVTSVKLTAIPSTGYVFSHWETGAVGGRDIPSNPIYVQFCTVEPGTSVRRIAVFEKVEE